MSYPANVWLYGVANAGLSAFKRNTVEPSQRQEVSGREWRGGGGR
jgi:hypothetical protein